MQPARDIYQLGVERLRERKEGREERREGREMEGRKEREKKSKAEM